MVNNYIKISSISIVFLLMTSFAFGGQFKVVRVYDGDIVKAIWRDIENKEINLYKI